MSTSPTTLKTLIEDARIFVLGGMRSMPMVLGGTMLLLGMFTANYAMLFFLVGFLVLVPLVVLGGNTLSNMMIANKEQSIFASSGADTCRVSIPYSTRLNNGAGSTEANVFSPWLALMVFFCTYLFTNALFLHNLEPVPNSIQVTVDPKAAKPDIETGKNRRKTQAVVSMICIVIFFLFVLYQRKSCDNAATMAVTALVFGFAGHGWFLTLESALGQGRLADLFGIANRLLAPAAISNQPIACVAIA